MSYISKYPIDKLPSVDDYLLGTDSSTSATRNFEIGDISNLQQVKSRAVFYKTTNQEVLVNNSPTPAIVTFNSSDTSITNGWIIYEDTKLKTSVTGIYNFEFTFFVTLGSGVAPASASFWLRKNGTTPLPNTAVTRVIYTFADIYIVNANYILSLNATDYIEVLMGKPTADALKYIQLSATENVFDTGVDQPSAIVTISQV